MPELEGEGEDRRAGRAGEGDLPICPFLGLRGDPASRAAYPRADHVCAVTGAPAPSLEWQGRYCLSHRYPTCRYYVAAQGQSVGEPVLGTPVGARRGRRLAVVGAGAAALVAIACVAALALSGLEGSDRVSVGPGPALATTATATPAATASPPAANAAPTATPTPSPTPTPRPSPTATPTPAASPTPRTHIVQPGETLAGIAARYGTTVDELARLNNIEDPNVISSGMVLRLPPATPESEGR